MKETRITPMPGYCLVERIRRKETTKKGIWVPRRNQEETPGAHVYHPGITGTREGIKQGDTVIVRPHCGHDFTLGRDPDDPKDRDIPLTILDFTKDEILGILDHGDLDVRNH